MALKFEHARIAPGKKDVHLKAIAAALNIGLRRALFFDDLPHNIRTAEALGVRAADAEAGAAVKPISPGCSMRFDVLEQVVPPAAVAP